MSTFAAPESATSGLQGYDLEGAKQSRSFYRYGGKITLSPEKCDGGEIEKAAIRAAGIALVTDDGKMLFVKRAEGGDHAGEWGIPAGKIEAGETAEQAAIRETMEEVGYTIKETDERVQLSQIANSDVEFTTFFHRLEGEFEPKLNAEHVGHRWASLDQPPEPLHPGLRAALPLIISQAIDTTMKSNQAVVTKRGAGEGEMENLSLFVQLCKVDAKQRIVYGTAVAEVADRSGEIFDYATSKPEFEKWSGDIEKSTDGKSKGNVRSMHGKIAAGKLTDIAFDDTRKAIDVAAKIVDEDEWKKVEEGVYTGFSIGGQYLKRWQDGGLKRYTARPAEVSLVDLPCVPTATFSMVKADGTEEMRKFATPAEPEAEAVTPETTEVEKAAPTITNEMVAERAEALAKASGQHFITHIEEARAQLEDELSKSAEADTSAATTETEATAEVTPEAEVAKGAEGEVTVNLEVDGEKLAEAVKITSGNSSITMKGNGDIVITTGEADIAKTTPSDVAQVWISDRLPGQHFTKKGDLQKALVDLDAKAAADAAAAPVLDAIKAAIGEKTSLPDGEVEKREFSAKEREKDAKSGAAEKDGSYPIENGTDLENAIKAYGESKNKAKTKRHIIARAKALGLTEKLPEGWTHKVAEGDLTKGANLYSMRELMHMLACVERMEDMVEVDYGTPLPKELTDRFGSTLVALGDVVADILDTILAAIGEEEAAEAAGSVTKSLELIELIKRGARNSASDKALIKQAHDALTALDKDCCGGMDKSAETGDLAKADVLAAENEALKTTIIDIKTVVVDGLAKKDADIAAKDATIAEKDAEIAKLKERNAELEKSAFDFEKLNKTMLSIRAMPAAAPYSGNFRIAEKGMQPEGAPASDDELRQRANAAQMRHQVRQ
ncbi:NUDIX domain-containing protein [Bradyrhizobium sp. Tv2a-2]|uniref:NUDIX domain-containing protein n=1 Tax=Bradyrhizobium sp. Tv2a-2 TaxID=113395 RepID=UPI000408871A|nr:NUDIX domain-containing protein [Bradyrhizobium sp. Tv2a-2]